MPAPESIRQLVERFEQHRDAYAYRAGKYNETQLRREFLDPFFEALGWDVFNKLGYSEENKHVIHEDSLEIEGAKKAPDYAFKVGKERKFFVEAKKPSVRIETNPEVAFQLKRYVWSAKLPLGILTDFEEFAVYECRSKPKVSDSVKTGRVMLLNYTDYIEKWDEIVSIFSYNAVMTGGFDKFAKSVAKKKGTAEVDSAFLDEIEGWREALAKNVALRNKLKVKSEADLNFAVQMTIDRMIFLRICEDRGYESEYQLQELSKRENVYDELKKLFERADRRYNSGLFHFKNETGRGRADTFTTGLEIDDKVLKDIIKDLYYPAPYVFALIPADILGQIYEQFLGKVIRLTASGNAKVEEKPEVRKAGGVYYTPTFIVYTIVVNTLGKLLLGLTPKEAARLKILDPACGSGTFLLGAYQYLLDWHLNWYMTNDFEKWSKGKNAVLVQSKDGWKLSVEKKKEILLNNIYGVDIDPQAVEVTKLSLLLKVIEDPGQLSYLDERILPDLGRNIQCGNSLIGPDYWDGQLMVDEEERARVNAFEWKAAFPEVFAQGAHSTGSGQGFDVVVGNPPYGASFTHEDDLYFSKIYKTFSATKDVYTCFIEKALSVSKEKGRMSFIVPSGWTGGPQYSALRSHLLNYQIENLILLPFDIFKDAYIDTLIFVIENLKASDDHKVKTYSYPKREKIKTMDISDYKLVSQKDWGKTDGNKFVLDPETLEILDRIKKKSARTLKDVVVMRRGVLFDLDLLHNKKDSEKDYRYFEGDVYRYRIKLKIERWVEFGESLKERPKESIWFENERVLLRRLVNRQQRLMACLTDQTFITNKNLYSIIPQGINGKVLLAVLNSKLLSFLYIKQVTQAVKDDFPQVTIKDVLSLPFPQEDLLKARHDKVVSLVERMLALHKSLKSTHNPQEADRLTREVESVDKSIDALVYQLYGLSEDEVKIVEGKA